MREACRSGDGNPGYELGVAARRGLARRPRQGLHRRLRHRLRLVGRAAHRGVDRQAGQGSHPRAGRVDPTTGKDRQGADAELPDPYALGAEFFRWEFAVAVAGAYLEINPFDQPDVQAAKDKTNEVLATGQEPELAPRELDRGAARAGEGGRLRLRAGVRPADAARTTSASPTSSRELRRDSGLVVTHGYGPRYLHSTGQLHKGGPNTGLFLQVVDDPGEELAIPGKEFGFRRFIRSQAEGDYESLKARDRRVARIHWED